jgi:hypothetical protein
MLEGLTFIPTVTTVADGSIQMRKNVELGGKEVWSQKGCLNGFLWQFRLLAIPL